jgi:hypothetical protein
MTKQLGWLELSEITARDYGLCAVRALNMERNQCECCSPEAWEWSPVSPVKCLRNMKIPRPATLRPEIAPKPRIELLGNDVP